MKYKVEILFIKSDVSVLIPGHPQFANSKSIRNGEKGVVLAYYPGEQAVSGTIGGKTFILPFSSLSHFVIGEEYAEPTEG